MIYCVVPEEFGPELLQQLTDYYADDAEVTVIVDRRKGGRRGPQLERAIEESRETRDRRKPPVTGEFPDLGG
ncbi:MAG TPA: hypothetical protein PKB03_08345 [Baekduia sp.]|nr:hypothetical protein [Baekduia sp.]